MVPAGISHIEFWVSDLKRSLAFYKGFFPIIGWYQLDENGFSNGSTKMYFMQRPVRCCDTIGPRHICFKAQSREVVDQVGTFLRNSSSDIIRGPLEVSSYSKGSYTVDFRDPDGYVLEVKHAPNAVR
jgi:catechol 2,3-dioxygenase-like lactoylglutathione lyase family enzyme